MPPNPGIFAGIREYILLSLKELPLIASVAPLFLGVAEGNINLLVFGLGILFVAPIAAGIVGLILSFLLRWLDPTGTYWKATDSDILSLVPGIPGMGGRDKVAVVPTYWMTMTVFFFSYLAMNAYSLYVQEPEKNADPEKVDNRKYQAIMSLILIGIIGLLVMGLRVTQSGGETVLGVIVALGTGITTSYFWFKYLSFCGLGRLEDVFGIRARILPESATADTPVVCV